MRLKFTCTIEVEDVKNKKEGVETIVEIITNINESLKVGKIKGLGGSLFHVERYNVEKVG